MTTPCNDLQQRLAEHGPTALQHDAEAQAHLVECEACYAFLEALAAVDVGLDALAPLEAPDGLVERTLAALADAVQTVPEAERPARVRRWPLSRTQTLGSALAASLVLVTSLALFQPRSADHGPTSLFSTYGGGASSEPAEGNPPSGRFTPAEPKLRADRDDLRDLARQKKGSLRTSEILAEAEAARVAQGALAPGEPAATAPRKELAENAPLPAAPPGDASALSELAYRRAQSLEQRANEAYGYLGERGLGDARVPETKRDGPSGKRKANKREAERGMAPERLRRLQGELADERVVAALEEPLADAEADELDALGAGRARGLASKDRLQADPSTQLVPSPAQRFIEERRRLEGLRFQPASGYWENTYVPGDPVMRWLQARLAQSDRESLQPVAGGAPLELESAARQTPQAFDAPTSAALSVFLHADQRGIEGEQRLLVQVGLRGADRHSGLRPAMNVGIVLDLRGDVVPETARSMRALVHAFLSAKEVGDHFSLIAAGRPGGTWVAGDDFRHGPVTLALARLEGADAVATPSEPTLSLEQAVARAIEETKRSDDPNAPLGSSLVLLVSARPLTGSLPRLSAMAHRSAVDGVPLSVVGVGDAIPVEEIDRLALAGQGNRRLLRQAADAESLVDRELSSLARVIARALRLRIRLAPGVELVEVVGAERLDAAGAARVRQAEKSIDRRLARNFGIEADRGEDEEGIQIVIPTFQSGDSHSVVLDVVASGPGPVADVTVRYKDLAYLRNGVARANLSLGRERAAPGPLERNVVKSYLAIRLSETLKQAGQGLLEGRDADSVAQVRAFRELLASFAREQAGYQNDTDLAADIAMLDEYLRVLDTGVLAQSGPRRTLADSLQLSGYFKTVPRPPSEDSRR